MAATLLELVCRKCGSTKQFVAGTVFNGKSIEDWFRDDCDELCKDCRQRSMTLDDAIEYLASTGEPFTSDDVLVLARHPDSYHRANGSNNGIGTAFRRASTRGRIKAVGVEKSKQPHRKGGMVRIWVGV